MKKNQTTLVLLAILFSNQLFAADLLSGQVVGWGHDPILGCTEDAVSQSSTGLVIIANQTLSNAVAICAGFNHSLAIKSDGTVVGWGYDAVGQVTGIPHQYNTNATVSFGGHNLNNVIAIAVGESHNLALKYNGTVIGWGINQSGQTTVPTDLSNVVAITAGGTHSLVLKKDGTVVKWGKANVPTGLTNIVAIAATRSFYGHDLAIKSDGTVVEWNIRNGASNVPLGLSNVLAIAAGQDHSLALKSDGTVFGWGFNARGQATGMPTAISPYQSSGLVTIDGQILNNVAAIAAGNEFNLALKKDGTVVAWGDNRWHQTDVPAGLSNVVAITCGDDFALAITTNSTVADKFRQK